MGKPPPLADMVWLSTNPAVKVCQYYSSICGGTAERLRLVFGRTNHVDFESWAEAYPRLLSMLRAGSQCAASWIHYFFINRAMCCPWLFVAIIDDRRDDTEHVIDELESLRNRPELCDEWFTEVFFGLIFAVDSIFAGLGLRHPLVKSTINAWG